MKIRVLILGAIFPAILISGCATSEKAAEEKGSAKTDEVVVMDDAAIDSVAYDLPDESPKPVEQDTAAAKPATPVIQVASATEEPGSYYVQVGAFSTLEKAELFAKRLKGKVKRELTVRYNGKKNLYAVRLAPVSSREEADSLLLKIRAIKGMADAFIFHD